MSDQIVLPTARNRIACSTNHYQCEAIRTAALELAMDTFEVAKHTPDDKHTDAILRRAQKFHEFLIKREKVGNSDYEGVPVVDYPDS